jgi:hypothetical protein
MSTWRAIALKKKMPVIPVNKVVCLPRHSRLVILVEIGHRT